MMVWPTHCSRRNVRRTEPGLVRSDRAGILLASLEMPSNQRVTPSARNSYPADAPRCIDCYPESGRQRTVRNDLKNGK
jgi:hypothetical protein